MKLGILEVTKFSIGICKHFVNDQFGFFEKACFKVGNGVQEIILLIISIAS